MFMKMRFFQNYIGIRIPFQYKSKDLLCSDLIHHAGHMLIKLCWKRPIKQAVWPKIKVHKKFACLPCHLNLLQKYLWAGKLIWIHGCLKVLLSIPENMQIKMSVIFVVQYTCILISQWKKTPCKRHVSLLIRCVMVYVFLKADNHCISVSKLWNRED